MCPHPGYPLHGSIAGGDRTFYVGSVVNFKCNKPGYVLTRKSNFSHVTLVLVSGFTGHSCFLHHLQPSCHNLAVCGTEVTLKLNAIKSSTRPGGLALSLYKSAAIYGALILHYIFRKEVFVPVPYFLSYYN